MAVLAALILLGSPLLAACSVFSPPPPPPVPVAVKVKPGADLLMKCTKSLVPDPTKTVEQNGEALADLAEKFRECEARQSKLVDWFE